MRVDVDTRRGLHEGVPRLLEAFGRRGVRASFFVTMGPDRSGAAVRRLVRPAFLRKMWRTNPFRLYGLRTMLSGTLLKAEPVGMGAPTLLRQIAAEGHEVAPHGFDHVGWQDGVHRWSADRVRADLIAAARAFESALGYPATCTAAPGWRTTPGALIVQEELGYAYASDVRGEVPFRPDVEGAALKTIQVPTTLPTMDELVGAAPDVPGALIDAVRPGLNVFTAHAEVEGGALAGFLEAFLDGLRRRGIPTVRLGDALEAARRVSSGIPVAGLARDRVAGRSGWVAVQGRAG